MSEPSRRAPEYHGPAKRPVADNRRAASVVRHHDLGWRKHGSWVEPRHEAALHALVSKVTAAAASFPG